jgi:DNA-binding transcriptional regulator GbsR (MarR family)
MQRRAPREDELSEDALADAQDICIETAGRLAEFWGFTRTMGRVYCALYLSPVALSQPDLVERLGVSAANVSMSLKGLMRWGGVHKVYERGTRKALYEAEGEIRTIIRNVLGGREQRELVDAQSRLREATALVRTHMKGPGASREKPKLVLERIEHLEATVRMSNRLLELLLGEGRVDVKRELGED